MDNNIQIALFFDQTYYIDTVLIAGKLKEKIELLGEGTVLPYDKNAKTPIVIFDNSEQIRLLIFTNQVLITFLTDEMSFIEKNLKIIFDLLKKIKMNISRIGYIKTITLGLQEATLFKNNAFDDNEILHADEYLVSYYKLVKINKINVNCWKKYSTNNNDFIISFDLNTLVDEDQNVDYNYTISYIKSCNKYIEENQIVNLF